MNIENLTPNISDGKFVYYPQNYVQDVSTGEVVQLDPSRYILIEGYVLDLQEKTFTLYNEAGGYYGSSRTKMRDSLPESVGEIKDIQFIEEECTKIVITPKHGEPVELGVNQSNQLVAYTNPNLKVVDNCCGAGSEHLVSIRFPNAERMRNFCFGSSNYLKELVAPQLKVVGVDCFELVDSLEVLDLKSVRAIAMGSFHKANSLKLINAPELEQILPNSFEQVNSLAILNLPSIKSISMYCFRDAKSLTIVDTPNLVAQGMHAFENIPSDCNRLHYPKFVADIDRDIPKDILETLAKIPNEFDEESK